MGKMNLVKRMGLAVILFGSYFAPEETPMDMVKRLQKKYSNLRNPGDPYHQGFIDGIPFGEKNGLSDGMKTFPEPRDPYTPKKVTIPGMPIQEYALNEYTMGFADGHNEVYM